MHAPMNGNVDRQRAVRRAVAGGFACLLLVQAADVLAQQAAPEILRGSSAPPPPGVAASEPSDSGSDVVAAGNRVWFVDRDEGTLVGCRLINTSYVGAERIECSARDLPEASR